MQRGVAGAVRRHRGRTCLAVPAAASSQPCGSNSSAHAMSAWDAELHADAPQGRKRATGCSAAGAGAGRVAKVGFQRHASQ
jgi:hypothetical protein